MNRIATSAVALVCVGFLGMSYASGQTLRVPTPSTPSRIFDLSNLQLADPPDDNAAEQAREVTKVVQELVAEAEKKRVSAPGSGTLRGGVIFPFPGLF